MLASDCWGSVPFDRDDGGSVLACPAAERLEGEYIVLRVQRRSRSTEQYQQFLDCPFGRLDIRSVLRPQSNCLAVLSTILSYIYLLGCALPSFLDDSLWLLPDSTLNDNEDALVHHFGPRGRFSCLYVPQSRQFTEQC